MSITPEMISAANRAYSLHGQLGHTRAAPLDDDVVLAMLDAFLEVAKFTGWVIIPTPVTEPQFKQIAAVRDRMKPRKEGT